MIKGYLFILICLFFVSCSTQKGVLTEKGRLVSIMYSKLHNDCEMVKKIVGEDSTGSRELATNNVRNLASEHGTNYIMITDEIINGKEVKVHAKAYRCP